MPDGRAPVEGGAVIQVIAPHCPDCGQVCLHPALMAVDCKACGGKGARKIPSGPSITVACTECNGTGKVAPPTLTDEQILGRKCSMCLGSGSDEYGAECSDCNDGTGRGGGIENVWECTSSFLARLDFRGDLASSSNRGPRCSGPVIVADDALWREFKQMLRTRTKTTVLENTKFVDDEDGGIFPNAPACVLCDFIPDGCNDRRGKWTVTITFE